MRHLRLKCLVLIAFEGLAHPYKDNVVKFNGKSTMRIGELPEVKKTLESTKSP
jgi:large subunit ribosomal protein L13